jgi:poly-gamma-glutamate synthesis protein (capsule biosynthesis protein)
MRPDVVSMYCPALDRAAARLVDMRMHPLRIRRFRLTSASAAEVQRLQVAVERPSPPPGIALENQPDGSLLLRWR